MTFTMINSPFKQREDTLVSPSSKRNDTSAKLSRTDFWKFFIFALSVAFPDFQKFFGSGSLGFERPTRGTHSLLNADMRPFVRCGLRANQNFNIAAKGVEESEKAIRREPGQTPTAQRGYLCLVDAEEFCRLDLLKAAFFDDRVDPAGQFSFRERRFRFGDTQVREHVPATLGNFRFRRHGVIPWGVVQSCALPIQ